MIKSMNFTGHTFHLEYWLQIFLTFQQCLYKLCSMCLVWNPIYLIKKIIQIALNFQDHKFCRSTCKQNRATNWNDFVNCYINSFSEDVKKAFYWYCVSKPNYTYFTTSNLPLYFFFFIVKFDVLHKPYKNCHHRHHHYHCQQQHSILHRCT